MLSEAAPLIDELALRVAKRELDPYAASDELLTALRTREAATLLPNKSQ